MDEDRIADAEQGGRPRHGRRTLEVAMWPGPATAPRPTQCRSSQLPTNPNSCRSGRRANRRISGGFTVEANLGQPLPSAHARQRDPDLTGGPSISAVMDEDRIADAEQGGRPRHGRRTLEVAMWPGPATAPRPTQCRSSQLPTNPNSCRSGRGANRRISAGFTVEANLGQPLPSAHARQRDPDLTDGPSISATPQAGGAESD